MAIEKRGFTLIEMLVVMFIIGIVLAIASVNLSRDPRQILATEAETLSLLLQHARDEAITSGAQIAWKSESGSHAFFEFDGEGKWRQLQSHFRARQWPPQVQLTSLQIDGVKAALNEPVVFTPSGFNSPFRLTLALNEARVAMSGDALGRIKIE